MRKIEHTHKGLSSTWKVVPSNRSLPWGKLEGRHEIAANPSLPGSININEVSELVTAEITRWFQSNSTTMLRCEYAPPEITGPTTCRVRAVTHEENISHDARVHVDIETAYEDLDRLLLRRHQKGESPGLDEEIEHAWHHLNALQQQESQRIIDNLDSGLRYSTNELISLLETLERNEDEDP